MILPVLFLLAIILIEKQWSGNLKLVTSLETFGWVGPWAPNIWSFVYFAFYISLIIAGLTLLFHHRKHATAPFKRQQLGILIGFGACALILGTLFNVCFLLLLKGTIPTIGDIFVLVWAIGMVYTISRYSFLNITPLVASGKIIETMSDLLILLDTDGNIASINKSTETLLGFKKAELEGKPIAVISENITSIISDLSNASLNNQSKSVTQILKTKFNTNMHVSLKSSIIPGFGFVLVARDITQEIQAKENIQTVMHDLKTPLSIIAGNTDKIDRKTSQNDELKPYIRAITDSITKSERQIDLLILLSLLDTNELKPSLTFTEYNSFLKLFCSQFKPQAEQKMIKFNLIIDDTNHATVNVDNTWLERIIGNLILNAFKFIHQGDSITISTTQDGEFIWTEISDSGPGIPADKIDHIFNRKYQADSNQKNMGYGLGLHIVQKLLQRLGGNITVTSEIDKGTTFSYNLPIHKQLSIINKHAASIPEQNSSTHFQQQVTQEIIGETLYKDQARFENKNPSYPSILICEDTPGQLQLIIDCLSGGYNLFLAKNGIEGFQKLVNNADRISLIISDVKMPDMDGIEFCKKVFADDRFKKLPLLFLTAYYNDDEQSAGLKYGATDYLQKPFNDIILLEKVNHWIARRESERVMENLILTLEQRTVTMERLQSILVHEIRNPLMLLAFINNAIQKLSRKYLNTSEEDRKCWEQAGNLQNVIESINTIISSSKDIEEQMKLNTANDILITSIFEPAIAQTTQYCQNIEFIIAHEVSENITIKCDIKLLTQVFINIIRNATEAINAKEGCKGIIRIETRKSNCTFQISISDNGIGIPKETQDKLFSYLYTTKKDGTGIGLYLSRKILRMHGGDISMQSNPGENTTATITLPI
jgi:PAS domain S-box-containing protein